VLVYLIIYGYALKKCKYFRFTPILLYICRERFIINLKLQIMKRINSLAGKFLVAALFIPFISGFSQESEKSNFSAGADFYSSYIWRGTKYGTGPHIQPLVKFNSGFFTAGGWGSFDFSGYQEADLFVSFALPAGFSAGVTDYYYPGLDYFDYSKETGGHAFEINGGFTNGGLALAGNVILNEAGGAGSAGRAFISRQGTR
jgi:hypothetical protein